MIPSRIFTGYDQVVGTGGRMPVRVVRRDGEYVVTDGDKVYGKHDTKTKANNQRKAIYANKKSDSNKG